jgi:hypothetical protein
MNSCATIIRICRHTFSDGRHCQGPPSAVVPAAAITSTPAPASTTWPVPAASPASLDFACP